jgi:hypothetical protein
MDTDLPIHVGVDKGPTKENVPVAPSVVKEMQKIIKENADLVERQSDSDRNETPHNSN